MLKAESLKYSPVYHPSSKANCVADQIQVYDRMEAKVPSKYLIPAPNAVRPLRLSAPLFGESQCAVPASFKFPPPLSESPRKSLNSSHSSFSGTCQPAGQSFPVFI